MEVDGHLLEGRGRLVARRRLDPWRRAFHQQAQRQDWTAAWAAVTAPVLVAYGEHDWFEDVDAARTVIRVVNGAGAARARLVVVPRMDHHFSVYPTPQDAFREKGGSVDEGPAVVEMLSWLRGLAP